MVGMSANIEVITIFGRVYKRSGKGESFDEILNRYLSKGWKILSNPVLMEDDIFIQQLYRDK